MTWDGTVTLGVVLQIASMVVLSLAGWFGFKARLTVFEHTLRLHAEKMTEHESKVLRYEQATAERLARHETTLVKVVGDIQRVIGQLDVWNGRERRGHGSG